LDRRGLGDEPLGPRVPLSSSVAQRDPPLPRRPPHRLRQLDLALLVLVLQDLGQRVLGRRVLGRRVLEARWGPRRGQGRRTRRARLLRPLLLLRRRPHLHKVVLTVPLLAWVGQRVPHWGLEEQQVPLQHLRWTRAR